MTIRTQRLSQDQIGIAADLLLRGEIVAFPTETVYGLGAPLFCQESAAKIFQIKGRPVDNPLIAHISSFEELPLLALQIPQAAWRLAEAFWPGPLTLVFKRRPEVPALVSAGMETIAVRMPQHPVALALIQAVGQPLVAPSANLSGRPSPTCASHVLEDLEGKIAAVVDGGSCPIGIESTVLSLLEEEPVILRPGAITESALQEVLHRRVQFYTAQAGGVLASPGMRYRHYAPVAPIKLFSDRQQCQEYLACVQGKVMLLSNEPVAASCSIFPLQAQTLYACLRQADAQAYEQVVILCDAAVLRDAGLMDRLLRAAAG